MAIKLSSVRIVSNGTVKGTRIYDAETGADLTKGIRRITFVHTAGALPTASIECLCPELDVVAEVQRPAKVKVMPGRVARLVRRLLRRK